jgi:hypothetical protein
LGLGKRLKLHNIMNKTRFILIGSAGLFLIGAWLLIAHLSSRQPELRATPPLHLIALLEKTLEHHQSVFLSPELYRFVPPGKLPFLVSLQDAVTAVSDTSNFYRLNREHHFSLLILGTLQPSTRLTRELADSPLWVLHDVSPWGYVLLPKTTGTASWVPPSPKDLNQQFPDAMKRSEWLISTSENLITIGKTHDAEELLQIASSTGKCLSSLQSAQASLAAAQGRWNDALSAAIMAHRLDPGNASAAEILIRALTECGQPDKALDVARQLTERIKNQETYFLLARAANVANSKEEEVRALRSLVALARENHQQLGASLTYLGQAYARNGERGEALRTFQEALGQGELTEEQRRLLRQLVDHLTPESPVSGKN